MYRRLFLSVLVLMLFAGRAQALEMFTSFHNGENIGFPPMEVPIAIYGHGGWNHHATKCPTRVESIESVPAMTPTGLARTDHVRTGKNDQTVHNQVEYVSDRRRSWSGPNDSSMAGYGQPVADYNSTESSSGQSPTPAKVAPKSDGWTRSLEPAPTDDKSVKKPTSVFARPGSAPQTESVGKIKPSADPNIDQRPKTTPGASSRRNNENPQSNTTQQSID